MTKIEIDVTFTIRPIKQTNGLEIVNLDPLKSGIEKITIQRLYPVHWVSDEILTDLQQTAFDDFEQKNNIAKEGKNG